MFYVFDLNGKLLRWNKSLPRVTGYRDDEIAKRNPLDFFSGEDRQRVQEAIERVTQQGTAHIEAEVVTKHGTRIPYELTGSLLTNSSGQVIGICGCGRDVSERQRAEESLRDSEAFLKTLLNAIPIPVFYKDGNGRYLGFNRAFEAFSDEADERLIGKTVFDISSPELAEAFHAKDNELFERGARNGMSAKLRTPGGSCEMSSSTRPFSWIATAPLAV